MKPCLIYYYYCDKKINVWEDWQNPVLLSIATARAFNPTIPIYVLDVSDIERSWDDYPLRLNFKHIKTHTHIPILNTDEIFASSYKICSRQFDIEWLSDRIPEDVLISVECDIIWLKELPSISESADRFYFNHFNSGYYYYNKNSRTAKDFRTWWKHYILLGLANENVRKELMSKYDWHYFQDETAMVWIVKSCGGMCEDIKNLNIIYNPAKKWAENYNDAINLHLIGSIFPKNRALLYLIVKEFWDATSKVLDVDQLYRIFGPEYQSLAGTISSDSMFDVDLSLIQLRNDFRLRRMGKLF